MVNTQIIKAPIDRIVEIGTRNGYKIYNASIGDTIYIVSNSVSVRISPNETSDKICTLNKDKSAKVIEIENDWYYISADGISGYIPKNCATTKIPTNIKSEDESDISKQQLINKLSFDMDLRIPTNMSLNQFKKVLSNDINDKNNVFESNAEYFYYMEKQYKINGIFVASVRNSRKCLGNIYYS